MLLHPLHTSGKYPEYPATRGPVLLLTCMDLRLMDDVMQFMYHDGLTNRYDHVIMAGAALGALGGNKKEFAHWKQTFLDHLNGAYELHHIKDIYIMEHRDCGAYHAVFKVAEPFGDSPDELQREADCHRRYAELLEAEIEQWAKKRGISIRVKSFLMGLRGEVELLSTAEYIQPAKRAKK